MDGHVNDDNDIWIGITIIFQSPNRFDFSPKISVSVYRIRTDIADARHKYGCASLHKCYVDRVGHTCNKS